MTEREEQLEKNRAMTAEELLDALLHGSCEPSTAEQALREKIRGG
jgi:hypothetical protein